MTVATPAGAENISPLAGSGASQSLFTELPENPSATWSQLVGSMFISRGSEADPNYDGDMDEEDEDPDDE